MTHAVLAHRHQKALLVHTCCPLAFCSSLALAISHHFYRPMGNALTVNRTQGQGSMYTALLPTVVKQADAALTR